MDGGRGRRPRRRADLVRHRVRPHGVANPAEPDKNRLAVADSCDNFLYGFKGAPSARHAYGRNRQRELARATGGEQSGRVTGDKRQGSPGSRRCGAAAFAAPFGRKPYGATSCRARLPRHRPQPVPAVTPRCRATRAGPGRHARAECADRRAKGHSHRAGTPRIVQVGPSSVKGTPRLFLTASQKRSSDPPLSAGASADPAGLTARARPKARPETRAANLPVRHLSEGRGKSRSLDT